MINVSDGNKIYYYHFDGLGSVVALSDVNNVIVESYSYDVFGEPDATSSIGNPYMFTGRRYDSETANYYYRARIYKPGIGRFLQPDPIGYDDGLNMYAYVGNNPVNWVDPLGLKLVIIGDKKVFQEANNYLSKSERFKETYNSLNKHEDTFYIRINNEQNDRFGYTLAQQGGPVAVHWDPYMASEEYETKKFLGFNYTSKTGVTGSPALNLAHEMEHMREYVEKGTLNLRATNDDYGTYEERRVIEGPERMIATQLGEPLRHSHLGELFRVDKPTKRCKKR